MARRRQNQPKAEQPKQESPAPEAPEQPAEDAQAEQQAEAPTDEPQTVTEEAPQQAEQAEEPKAEAPAPEQPADQAPARDERRANADAQLDRTRNEIAGARCLVETLRNTGTGKDKLNAAEDWIADRQRRLNGTQIKPIKFDSAQQHHGAKQLIEDMQEKWPAVTLDKARQIVNQA